MRAGAARATAGVLRTVEAQAAGPCVLLITARPPRRVRVIARSVLSENNSRVHPTQWACVLGITPRDPYACQASAVLVRTGLRGKRPRRDSPRRRGRRHTAGRRRGRAARARAPGAPSSPVRGCPWGVCARWLPMFFFFLWEGRSPRPPRPARGGRLHHGRTTWQVCLRGARRRPPADGSQARSPMDGACAAAATKTSPTAGYTS